MEMRAYAKVNLTLDVLGKRADGFHSLSSVMLALDLFDVIAVDFSAPGVFVEADPPLPAGSVAERAARAYLAHCKGAGLRASIQRAIPPGAGLGGSSADAAALLNALHARYRAMEEQALLALAASLGADIPFCMAGGLALCEGKGEIITPLPKMDFDLLVVKPARGAATREVFARLAPPYPPQTSAGAVAAICAGNRAALLPHISNGLQEAAGSLVPEIAHLLDRMRDCGALASSMTGSGSAVFGIFENAQAARLAARAFAGEAFVRACRPPYPMV